VTRATLLSYADAWRAGDITRMLDAYADDVVFHYFGETDLAGDHVGKDAAVGAMLAASTRSSRTLVEIVDVLAGDERGAIVAIERFERDGESQDVQRVLLYRVHDGLIVECWLYDGDQRMIDRFWAP
jgi:ketosteroid isomerase-like protein